MIHTEMRNVHAASLVEIIQAVVPFIVVGGVPVPRGVDQAQNSSHENAGRYMRNNISFYIITDDEVFV